MNNTAISFCRDILKEVSRSFSLTIPMLDNKIKDAVMIVYLQDRLLDNFEDELPDISDRKRRALMDKVVEIFNPAHKKAPPEINEIVDYADDFEDKSLRKLTQNIDLIWEAYQGLDAYVKARSFYWLKEMNTGMKKYLDFSIDNFDNLDEYCYYVAGTVGGFLSDLIITKFNPGKNQIKIIKDNFNEAGLFLQKVNITRDIREDILNRERIFWPLKELDIQEDEFLQKEHKEKALGALEQMINNTRQHIPALMDYYEALPEEARGYKRFFAVNNALGLATLERIKDNADVFYSSKPVKVSKLEFLSIMKSPSQKMKGYAQKEIKE
ncbi:MAG: squalene/phytoene synthase family protein [Bacillota bacterium]